METGPPNVVPLDAYREMQRRDEIDALNFGTRHRPGDLDGEVPAANGEDPQ